MTASLDDRLAGLVKLSVDAQRSRGMRGLAVWTQFMDEARDVVNRYRGLELADLIYLHGHRLREIQDELREQIGREITHQGVNDWVHRWGPTRYLTVSKDFTLHHIPILSMTQTRRELRAAEGIGRRIVPARWDIADDADGRELWDRLEPLR